MHKHVHAPNSANLSVLLQGYIPRSHLLQIHAQMYRLGAHQDNLIATRLIGHNESQSALTIFHQLQRPNIFPFNAIIRVLAEEGLFSNAISLFKSLKRHSLYPNEFTFSFLLKSCFRSKSPHHVKQLHTHILKTGFDGDLFVSNGLVNVYAKGLKDLVSGRKVFDEIPQKGRICCWTSLIAGFAQSEESIEGDRVINFSIQIYIKESRSLLTGKVLLLNCFPPSKEVGGHEWLLMRL